MPPSRRSAIPVATPSVSSPGSATSSMIGPGSRRPERSAWWRRRWKNGRTPGLTSTAPFLYNKVSQRNTKRPRICATLLFLSYGGAPPGVAEPTSRDAAVRARGSRGPFLIRSGSVMAKEMTGAQMVMHALTDQGVSHVFGYPGGAVLPIYDAMFSQDKVKHILVRH